MKEERYFELLAILKDVPFEKPLFQDLLARITLANIVDTYGGHENPEPRKWFEIEDRICELAKTGDVNELCWYICSVFTTPLCLSMVRDGIKLQNVGNWVRFYTKKYENKELKTFALTTSCPSWFIECDRAIMEKAGFLTPETGKIKIGIQGELGSNCEEAAVKLAEKYDIKNYEIIPLVTSANVAASLNAEYIDYGVMATENSIAGRVAETELAMRELRTPYHISLPLYIPIHHCIFKKPDAKAEDLNTIVSHIQALKQTRYTRDKLCPGLKEIKAEDTAAAARKLSEGIYPDNYAVICRKNAGKMYGLELWLENVEDDKSNETAFVMLELEERPK